MIATLFKSITQTTGGKHTPVLEILEGIKEGKWQDACLKVAAEEDKEKRTILKKSVPYFTVSGTFEKRANSGLSQHSGLIAIDFDEIDNLPQFAEQLSKDPYSFAVFRSVSGRGLCCIVRIDPTRHDDAFLGLQLYYWNQHRLQVDIGCKDVSRARYVSYDPDLFLNEKAKRFSKYLPKQKRTSRPAHTFTHTESKFDRFMQKLDRDITGDYIQWRNIAFALASEYGEQGRDRFHHISSYSSQYETLDCDKAYSAAMRSQEALPKSGKSKTITISSLYYYAHREGIDLRNKREEKIAALSRAAKESGRDEASVRDILAMEGETVSEDDAKTIAATFSAPLPPAGSSNTLDIDEVQAYLKANYPIKRNALTRNYEMLGSELESEDLNTTFIETKKQFANLSREIFDTILFSSHTPTYNPIKQYLSSLTWDGEDHIDTLCASITSDTGTPQWRREMIEKWLIGIVETVMTGEPNILNLVLTGKGNTGKTQFFKRLLPPSLRPYFANSQMDKGKDDEILMTQKLIIFDDEYSGKSKQDSKRIKMLLSADSFTLREPYGRKNVTLRRLASFCGTCNEVEVLNDLTGNRRVIVIEASGEFNYDLYNSVDKEQVFAQVMALLKSGETSMLSNSQISDLNTFTSGKYSETSIEGESLRRFFSPSDKDADFRTTTDIKDHIEKNTKQHLVTRKLGMELRRLGYIRVKRHGLFGYLAKDLGKGLEQAPIWQTPYQAQDDEPLPF